MFLSRYILRCSLAVSGLAGWSSAQAQDTIILSWSAAQAQSIPTLSMGALMALAVFLAVMSYRLLAKQPGVVRALLPLCVAGTTGWLGVAALESDAGLLLPDIEASACNGSGQYSVDTVPPCFVNQCGAPVTVSYRYLEAEGLGTSVPLSEAPCNLNYTCQAYGIAAPDEPVAEDGAQIPSGPTRYSVASCVLQEGDLPPLQPPPDANDV
jgi:hypothetical protein